MVRSFFTSCVILLSFALLESAILSNVSLLPAVPDFLLICTIFFACVNGRIHGTVNGFFSGLLLDFLTAAPLGLHCIVRTTIGYACGFSNKTLNLNGVFLPAMLGAVATLAKAFLIWGVSIVFPISAGHYDIFSAEFLFEISANAVLTPVMFKFLGIFRKTLVVGTDEAS
ncbi:MAG: rod shape-determining protein MreD [Treponema sp.]|nr:rod shape-determining protein MreD [Treponema sp.]